MKIRELRKSIAILEKERSLIGEQIAGLEKLLCDKLGKFKVGQDVVIKSRWNYGVKFRIDTVALGWFSKKDVRYSGRMVKKDGSLSRIRKAVNNDSEIELAR